MCVSRSVSAAALCLCQRLRVSCGSKRMGRSRGRSVTSSSGLQGSTTSQRAKPRSVRLDMVYCRHTVTLLRQMKMGSRNVRWGYENQIHTVCFMVFPVLSLITLNATKNAHAFFLPEICFACGLFLASPSSKVIFRHIFQS